MGMIEQKYDRVKIEKLKNFLEDMAGRQQPRPFEIWVDNLKVVPKTENPDDFEGYEQYMDNHTEHVLIVIYGSTSSPRNEKYGFVIQKEKEKGLNGLGEIESMMQERLDARDREHEMADLRKELSSVKKQLEDAEEYAEDLEQQLRDYKEGRVKKNLHLGELASVVLEGFVRRNPQILSRLPGGEALAGVIARDNEEKERSAATPNNEPSVSFQKKQDAQSSIGQLSEQQLQYMAFVAEMEAKFNDAQMAVVMQIIGRFMQEPAQLQTVAELLNIQTSSDE